MNTENEDFKTSFIRLEQVKARTGFGLPPGLRRVFPFGQQPLGALPRLTGVLEAYCRINAYRESFLRLVEPIGEAPAFRAVGRNP